MRTIADLQRYEFYYNVFSSLNILKLNDINSYCFVVYVLKLINSLIVIKYFNIRVNKHYN